MMCSIVIGNGREEEGGLMIFFAARHTDRRTEGQTINKRETEFWCQPRSDAINNNLRPVEYHFWYSFSWSGMGFDR